jgi:hypothetical protein
VQFVAAGAVAGHAAIAAAQQSSAAMDAGGRWAKRGCAEPNG